MEKEIFLQKINNRFNRVAGQIRAIQNNVQENPDADCREIIYQIKAARNALKKISDSLLERKINQCVDVNKKELTHLKEALEILSKEY